MPGSQQTGTILANWRTHLLPLLAVSVSLAPVLMILFRGTGPFIGICVLAILAAGVCQWLARSALPGLRSSARRIAAGDIALRAHTLVLVLVSCLICFFYLDHVGENPAGLFCDEAQIGLQAYRLPYGTAEILDIPLFMRNFGYVHVGTPPLIAAAPFVALFGLDAFSVRLTSSVLMLATMAVLYSTLRWLKLPFAGVGLVVFALSPIVIHVGRINLGHPTSVFLIALGFYLFVRARTQGSMLLAAWAGACFGISAYSNGPFYVFTPMVLGAIGLSELCFNERRLEAWRTYLLTCGVALLWLAPFGFSALSDPEFFRRVHDKQLSGPALFSFERLREIIFLYPRYFGFDFLFSDGPGGYLTRHYVPGAGLLPPAMLPIFALSIYSLCRRWHHPAVRFLLPWMIIAAAYPLPDLLTTAGDQPPYTLAVYGAVLSVPFLCALSFLVGHAGGDARARSLLPDAAGSPLLATVASLVLVTTVASGTTFYFGPYARYPLVSSDYWGWQYGPREMINYYQEHWQEYDQFLMNGNYNGAYVFLDFYLLDPAQRSKASLGGLERFDPAVKQLFGVRAEEWNAAPSVDSPFRAYFRVRKVFPYPNGQPAAYMVERNPTIQIVRGWPQGDGSWTY